MQMVLLTRVTFKKVGNMDKANKSMGIVMFMKVVGKKVNVTDMV